MSESLAGDEAYALYRGEDGAAWRQSREAVPVFGAPIGFRRYHVVLDAGTFHRSILRHL